MAQRLIESTFHDLTTTVEAPDNLAPGRLVAWLREHNPESLTRVCPFEDCDCEIDEWDAAGTKGPGE